MKNKIIKNICQKYISNDINMQIKINNNNHNITFCTTESLKNSSNLYRLYEVMISDSSECDLKPTIISLSRIQNTEIFDINNLPISNKDIPNLYFDKFENFDDLLNLLKYVLSQKEYELFIAKIILEYPLLTWISKI